MWHFDIDSMTLQLRGKGKMANTKLRERTVETLNALLVLVTWQEQLVRAALQNFAAKPRKSAKKPAARKKPRSPRTNK